MATALKAVGAGSASAMSHTMQRSYTGKYRIAGEFFERFPTARVGVGLVKIIIESKPKDKGVDGYLSSIRQEQVREFINTSSSPEKDGFVAWQKVFSSWSKVFKTYGVSEDRACTLVPLHQRIAREAAKIMKAEANGKNMKADLGRSLNIVTLCNYISMCTRTPMGVIDLGQIQGDITLRSGKKGEKFTPIGEPATYEVENSHVALADDIGVITWLWVHKIGERCCIRESADAKPVYVLVCSDQAEEGAGDAEGAIKKFVADLSKIKGEGVFLGVADKQHPEVIIDTMVFEKLSGAKIGPGEERKS